MTAKVMMWVALGGFVLSLISYCSPHDDTDPPHDRSGLRVLTDARTGCQYLTTFWSSPTPRMDKDGKQVCQ